MPQHPGPLWWPKHSKGQPGPRPMATKPMRGRTRLWQFSFEPDVLASAPHLNLPFSPVQSGQFYQNFTTPPWQPMLSSTTFLYQKHSFYQNFTPLLGSTCFFEYNIPLSKTFLLSKFSPPLGSPCFQWFRLPGVICDPTWPKSRGQPMLSMIQVNRGHLRPYLTSVPWAAHAFKYRNS